MKYAILHSGSLLTYTRWYCLFTVTTATVLYHLTALTGTHNAPQTRSTVTMMSSAVAHGSRMRSARYLASFARADYQGLLLRLQERCAVSGTASFMAAAPCATTTPSMAVRAFSDRPAKKNPKAKKKKPQGKASEPTGRSKELELILASLDAPSKVEGPVPEEERERRVQIGRNYVIGRFQQHNEMDHDLTCKMHLKRHALRMLKRHTRLNEEALRIDDDQAAPLWRHMPVWTPPIPGFDPSNFIDKNDK
jgi:hypothetical protein